VEPSWSTLISKWQTGGLDLSLQYLELGIALLYLAGVRRARRVGRRWQRWHTQAFLGGLFVIVMAFQSGFAAYDQVPWVHVVQHMSAMALAAPLLAFGAPLRLATVAGNDALRRVALDFTSDPAARLADSPVGGVFTTLDYHGSMIIYMVTPWYAASIHHQYLHVLTHAYFLTCGLLFWLPVSSVNPTHWRPTQRLRLLMVSLGLPAAGILAATLFSRTVPLAGANLHDSHLAGWAALASGCGFGVASLVAITIMRPGRTIRNRGDSPAVAYQRTSTPK
jgi:cytochrome c oxidase assembly factor CtaG